MTDRTIVGLLLGASAVGGTAWLFISRTIIGRTVRCDEFIEQSVRSADGEFVATSTVKECPAEPLSTTNYSVSVALSFKSRAFSSANQTLVFESADAAKPPTLTWVNGHELLLRVNDFGEVRASKHEVGGVGIRYTVPTWIWDRLGTIEADRLQSERASQDLYNHGKLSKDDLRLSSEIEDAAAFQRSNFRQWILANATIEGQPH